MPFSLSLSLTRTMASSSCNTLRAAGARLLAAPGAGQRATTTRAARSMGGGRPAAPVRGLAVKASMADDVKAKNAKYPVIVYSKTYCPYCTEVKALFKSLAVPATVVELDTLADGDAVAAGVAEVTGRRTVPQVFIGGAHVGGCDDTVAANKSGELKKMLAGVGIAV